MVNVECYFKPKTEKRTYASYEDNEQALIPQSRGEYMIKTTRLQQTKDKKATPGPRARREQERFACVASNSLLLTHFN